MTSIAILLSGCTGAPLEADASIISGEVILEQHMNYQGNLIIKEGASLTTNGFDLEVEGHLIVYGNLIAENAIIRANSDDRKHPAIFIDGGFARINGSTIYSNGIFAVTTGKAIVTNGVGLFHCVVVLSSSMTLDTMEMEFFSGRSEDCEFDILAENSVLFENQTLYAHSVFTGAESNVYLRSSNISWRGIDGPGFLESRDFVNLTVLENGQPMNNASLEIRNPAGSVDSAGTSNEKGYVSLSRVNVLRENGVTRITEIHTVEVNGVVVDAIIVPGGDVSRTIETSPLPAPENFS